ncbi:hypothetical protein JCM10213_002412 [Rhodosporidiobolus nylandii]
MLKAKAKAAATAAAAKRKAAAAAAAAAEAAAQQAAAAASGMGTSTTRSGRGIRPNVTQYWADANAQLLAPGGGLQKIGYDQAAFEDAVRSIIFGQEPSSSTDANAEASTSASRPGVIEEKKSVEAVGEAKEEEQVGEGYKTDKEALAVILDALPSVPSAAASRTLRQHHGDLVGALRELSGPVPVTAAA